MLWKRNTMIRSEEGFETGGLRRVGHGLVWEKATWEWTMPRCEYKLARNKALSQRALASEVYTLSPASSTPSLTAHRSLCSFPQAPSLYSLLFTVSSTHISLQSHSLRSGGSQLL